MALAAVQLLYIYLNQIFWDTVYTQGLFNQSVCVSVCISRYRDICWTRYVVPLQFRKTLQWSEDWKCWCLFLTECLQFTFLTSQQSIFSSHDFYAEAQKTALLPIFQCRVYLLPFHMLCFKCLTVCATVSKYNGNASYGAQTPLSLSLAPLDLSVIWCRCT